MLSNISGLDKIEFLQSHENREIYQKAFDMIERYFGTEEEDRAIAPEVDQNSEQYQFNAAQNAPMGGFQFWIGGTTTDEKLHINSPRFGLSPFCGRFQHRARAGTCSRRQV